MLAALKDVRFQRPPTTSDPPRLRCPRARDAERPVSGSASYAAMHAAPNSEPVTAHYSTAFRYGTPVLCGSKALRTPAASDPRFVSCDACLQRMAAAERAARADQVRRYG